MTDLLAGYFLIIKALHITAVVAWVGGQLTLPILVRASLDQAVLNPDSLGPHSPPRQVIRFLVNPAMILALLLGFALAASYGVDAARDLTWLKWKLGLVVVLAAAHGMSISQVNRLARAQAVSRSAPLRPLMLTIVALLGISALAVFKPV